MGFSVALFPEWLWVAAWPLYAALLLGAVWRAPWRCLRNRVALHLLLGTSLAMLLLWRVQAQAGPGMELHFLGVTAATLVLGWQFALLSVTGVVVGLVLNGNVPWPTMALQLLVLGAVPILLTHGLLVAARRFLPPNLFIYTLFNGFFGAGLGIAGAVLMLVAAMALGGGPGWQRMATEYVAFLPLVILPEGILNGFTVVVLAVNRPSWLATFDVRRYFGQF